MRGRSVLLCAGHSAVSHWMYVLMFSSLTIYCTELQNYLLYRYIVQTPSVGLSFGLSVCFSGAFGVPFVASVKSWVVSSCHFFILQFVLNCPVFHASSYFCSRLTVHHCDELTSLYRLMDLLAPGCSPGLFRSLIFVPEFEKRMISSDLHL